MFETIDQILTLLAVAIALGSCAQCFRTAAPRCEVPAVARAGGLREDAVIAAVLAYLFGAMIFSTVAQALFPDSGDVRSPLIAGSGAQVVGLIACLMIASRVFAGGARSFIFGGASASRFSAVAFVGCAVVAVGLCPLVRDGTVMVVEAIVKGYEFPSHPTIVALGGEGVGFSVVVALWIGASVIAPLAEEAFFRGILQTYLLNLFGSRRRAILFSSLAFGLVHFPQPQAIPALVVLGIVLGYSYERSGSLLVPVLLHAIFNLKTLVWYAAVGSPE